jgi:NAD(P)-dependent dehydrogenase (short-subunit alcohol dehydrogenase family)
MTLPAEATGAAPGRGRLTGRRVLVVGAGTRPSPEPDPPPGDGRAISVLAAREGAAVACADRDAGAAEATAALVRAEHAEHAEGPGNGGQAAAVVLADVAAPDACAAVVADSAAALGGLDGVVLNVGIGLGREASRLNPGRTARLFSATPMARSSREAASVGPSG